MLNIAHNVATKVTSAVHHIGEEVLGLFTMSDNKIMDLIYETHVHADETFDDDSLFIITENILKRSTQIVDKLVQGSQVHVENIDEKTPKPNFSVPLCKLKEIGCELSCKAPGEDVAHKTTLAILNKLSTYPWEAKAVLALAAFAYEYGDFWFLAQNQHSDQLANSLGILKRVPVLTKPAELQKRRQAVLELNNLIKATLQVIEIIFEFEKLSTYDPKDIPRLSIAMDHIPVDVYWSILTVVASSTKLTILTGDEDKPYDLSPYSQKIHYILNKLKIQLIVCRRQFEEAEAYRKIRKIFQTPTEVMEVFRALTFTKDKPQPLIDGSSNKQVNIDVLRKKNVFLFISTLEITEEDISILKPIYEGTKTDNNYKIVWFPLVEQWTNELQKKFEILRSKMPWFTIQSISATVGIKFIKEEWHFKGKPTLVVMNPQGKIENPNALHLIRLWGMKAFPFNKAAEETISKETSWIGPVVNNIDPVIQTWIKEEKYIFFYGGKDNEWVQQFNKRATIFASDPIFKDAKINIELFCIGKSPKGGEDHGILGRFWNGIESLFFTKAHKQIDPVTQEIQKLLSYKNESGWALLSKGSTVVIAGHGFTILKALEEFDKWKDTVREKGFEISFREYHLKLIQSVRHCCRLDIPSVSGKVPEKMQCPECPRTMETFISFKCCHTDGPNAHH
ncbi:protein SIEVE ELEMENT OCCLUSION B-like [Ziziphus jujuba]|uniref:Protein SIEVE ELEMENT OCCLUSION B-like n=1 Tax=Ziziphus jujuba TaxID=326968 RepID=A0ABM3IPU6_ZIZJJ|nr:protein SIEVE ELEMENT OCCLUSION B-like [Ziziphus jujuba]